MTNDSVQGEKPDETVVEDDAQKATEGATSKESEAPKEESTEDDLDSLLQEFEQKQQQNQVQQTQQTTQQQTTSVDEKELSEAQKILAAADAARKQAESLRDELNLEKSRAAVTSVVNRINDGVEADSRIVRAWLEVRAQEDPRLLDAFNQREASPKKWGDIENKLNSELKKVFGSAQKVDEEVTESKEAVSAAVKGSSTAAPAKEFPSDEEIMEMTDAEFRKLQRKFPGVPPM